jgi:hypothetical protein
MPTVPSTGSVKAFGFEVRLKIEGEGGLIEHSELVFAERSSWSATSGVSRISARGWSVRVSVGNVNTQSVMLYVDDVDAHLPARSLAAH